MSKRVRWLLPPAGILAAAAPLGLARPPDGVPPPPVPAWCCAATAAPLPAATRPLGLELTVQGRFTRVPPAVDVRGRVTVVNPNPTTATMDGLEITPSVRGSCDVVAPLQVPAGRTPIAFSCSIDIPDAARAGSVDVTARSRSVAADVTTTVPWIEAATSDYAHAPEAR
jgi:hypothetical protein